MEDKTKNVLITILFLFIIVLMLVLNVLAKDKLISETERRKLAQFPKITLAKLANGDVTDNLEKYTTDQFVARDFFRGIKSFFNFNIYMKKDNNDLFEKNSGIYKMEYPLKKDNVIKSADRIDNVYKKYLQGANVYYAIIPDKNYYLENDDHLKMEYEELKQIMNDRLDKIQYIDIWSDLDLDDYYKTDLHWKQENLQNVITTIKKNMNLEETNNKYTLNSMGEFYGAYYGQLISDTKPDILYTLTNETIEESTTYNFETQKLGKVYEDTNSSDKYDIYLSGATPLIRIENPNAKNTKELLLFRDSFGSSIAPLLIENYSKITLIDLRYISSNLLENYIEFKDQDVLFLYSALILNQNVLK